jgi:hypothetical protein
MISRVDQLHKKTTCEKSKEMVRVSRKNEKLSSWATINIEIAD